MNHSIDFSQDNYLLLSLKNNLSPFLDGRDYGGQIHFGKSTFVNRASDSEKSRDKSQDDANNWEQRFDKILKTGFELKQRSGNEQEDHSRPCQGSCFRPARFQWVWSPWSPSPRPFVIPWWGHRHSASLQYCRRWEWQKWQRWWRRWPRSG